MVSPAVTASSPSRIGAIGMPAGWPVEAGWPVAARSEGITDGAAAVEGAGCVVPAGAADAIAEPHAAPDPLSLFMAMPPERTDERRSSDDPSESAGQDDGQHGDRAPDPS